MIRRFRMIDKNLFRGSAPSTEDIILLNKKFGIKNIISLDQNSGNKIDRICKVLDIDHKIIPINVGKKYSILNFFNNNLQKLFERSVPTFIHCIEGKDRTGFVSAFYRCKFQNWPIDKALDEAKALGFGVGVDPETIKYYTDILHTLFKTKSDKNNAEDIAEKSREFNASSIADNNPLSWSPYEDYRVKKWPISDVHKDVEEQYETRQTFDLPNINEIEVNVNTIPLSGIYDENTQGIGGAGPSFVGSGYV
jgi:hypothetical protein